MNLNLKKNVLMTAVIAATAMTASVANAGATINFGEDKSISVGFGFITSYTAVDQVVGDTTSDFSLNSARIYLSGSMNKYIKGMFNTERSGGGQGNIEVIDANVQFQLTPEIAIWAGRFLSPSDRANMAGPYYSMGGGDGYWANIASRYGWNGGVIGRDEGVAIVTSFMEDHLALSFGAFEGQNIFRFSGVPGLGSTNAADDSLMYAGRIQYDFWDAEPGYYGTGNYFGAADILAIGIAGRSKSDGAVLGAAVGDYSSYSVDFLMEKKDVGPGTVSVEAAYYDYDTDDVALAEQGQAYSIGAAYLFNEQVGWGKIMPLIRYQQFDADSNVKTEKYEIGVNYVIAPYNSVISAVFSNTDTGATDTDAIKVSLQMQF